MFLDGLDDETLKLQQYCDQGHSTDRLRGHHWIVATGGSSGDVLKFTIFETIGERMTYRDALGTMRGIQYYAEKKPEWIAVTEFLIEIGGKVKGRARIFYFPPPPTSFSSRLNSIVNSTASGDGGRVVPPA